MSDTSQGVPIAVRSAPDQSAVSWPAIFAGGLAALGLTLILLAVGSAVGFSSVSPWSGAGVSGTTFAVSTGLYLIVVGLVASTVGGYLAGRLRTKWASLDIGEVRFRDTTHGLLAWAFATVLGAATLGTAATYLVGGAVSGAAGGAVAGAAADGADGPTGYFADMLFRPAAVPSAAAPAAAGPASPEAADSRTEATRILVHGLATDEGPSAADRTYLAQLVAAETGMDLPTAEARVTEVVNAATEAADEARETAAAVSIWLAISMLVGAFAAALAALEGGQQRDGTFRPVIFRRI